MNPTPAISKRVRVYTTAAERKRADLRTALAPSTPTGEPMSESALGRRLAGEHTWDVHELALIAENLGVTLADLIAGTDRPDTTEES
jgi:hypothetical protein